MYYVTKSWSTELVFQYHLLSLEIYKSFFLLFFAVLCRLIWLLLSCKPNDTDVSVRFFFFTKVGSLAVFVLRHRSLLGGGKQDLQQIARVVALNMVQTSFYLKSFAGNVWLRWWKIFIYAGHRTSVSGHWQLGPCK